MPRRLLIRGAQPLIPCTPLSRYRRYKSPCRAIFCLLSRCSETIQLSYLPVDCRDSTTSPDHHHPCWDHLSCELLSPRDTYLSLVFEHYSSPGTALPLSYLLATVEISLESPRVIARSSGGSTPVSTYQTDHNNSSSQSLRTHLPDRVYRATTLCAHSKTLAPTTCPEKTIPPNSPDVYVTPKSHARTCLRT